MKVSQILAPFLALLILNSSLSTNFILKSPQNDKKLSNYVCKITKDIINSKTDTQDVLIGNLGGKMWSSTVNDIAGCVRYDSAVVVSGFEKVVTESTFRRATLTVLMFNAVGKNMLTSFLSTHLQSTNWNHLTKVVCIVSSTSTLEHQFVIIRSLLHYGFLNFIVVRQVQNDIETLMLSHLPDKLIPYKNEMNINKLFPDKLVNLNGYPYRIVIYHQNPKVLYKNGTFTSSMTYFMLAVAKIQNANVQVTIIRDHQSFQKYWIGRHMDLTYNTGVKFLHVSEPKLRTYEENGYCALVPLPSKVSTFQSIFTKPFDGLTWMFFVLTMVCSVVVWWLFRGRGAVDSPWLLLYGMFVMFIGQGVEFSRRNRIVLTILLQLIIFMIWVLSNAYEGVITSFMIQPIQEHRLETFDELVASDYEILTDESFEQKIRASNSYKLIKPRLNSSGDRMTNFFDEVLRKHFVFILTCDQIESRMNSLLKDGTKVVDHYYVLKDKFLSNFDELEASFLNPFIERLQYYMDLSFQAGLPYIWKVLTFAYRNDSLQNSIGVTQALLMLKDLKQAFYLLFIGFLLSFFVLCIEIFFHDILEKLKLMNLARKLRNRVNQMAYKKNKQLKHPKYQKGALYYIIHRHKRVKRLKAKKLKVRRIYVQPRFPMD